MNQDTHEQTTAADAAYRQELRVERVAARVWQSWPATATLLFTGEGSPGYRLVAGFGPGGHRLFDAEEFPDLASELHGLGERETPRPQRLLVLGTFVQGTGEQNDDAWTCLCGNRPDITGWSCYQDSALIEPVAAWTSQTHICLDCGLLITPHGRIVGRDTTLIADTRIAALWEDIEEIQYKGDWNGGDVVDAVGRWFTSLGYTIPEAEV